MVFQTVFCINQTHQNIPKPPTSNPLRFKCDFLFLEKVRVSFFWSWDGCLLQPVFLVEKSPWKSHGTSKNSEKKISGPWNSSHPRTYKDMCFNSPFWGFQIHRCPTAPLGEATSPRPGSLLDPRIRFCASQMGSSAIKRSTQFSLLKA